MRSTWSSLAAPSGEGPGPSPPRSRLTLGRGFRDVATRITKAELDIIINGAGSRVVAKAYRVVLDDGPRADTHVERRTACAPRDADVFAIEQDGREIGRVERLGRGLVARVPGRFGVDPVASLVEGARFCANNQVTRPDWMR